MSAETFTHSIGPADGVTVHGITGSIAALYSNPLIVPRNTRAHLVRMHGAICDAEDILQADNRASVALIKSGNAPPTTWSQLKKVWSHVMSRSIVGTPANAAILAGGVELEKDLLGGGNSLITNIGASSNQLFGWQMVGVAATTGYDILMDVNIDVIFEWLNGSGSKKNLGWIDDEEQQ